MARCSSEQILYEAVHIYSQNLKSISNLEHLPMVSVTSVLSIYTNT